MRTRVLIAAVGALAVVLAGLGLTRAWQASLELRRAECRHMLAATRVYDAPMSPLGVDEWRDWCRDDPRGAKRTIIILMRRVWPLPPRR